MRAFALAVVGGLLGAGWAAGADEGSFDKSVSVSGRVELDAQTDSGGITITVGSPGVVRVRAILKASHGWFTSGNVEARILELERNPPIEQTGNRVRVGYVRDRDLLKDISMRLEIQTPADTQVRAHADSGGIRVEGVQGTVDCKTDSGGIEIRNVRSAVRAAADSGGIRISDVGGSVVAHVDSGAIEAIDVAGSIEANADSGGIRLVQTKAAPIRAKADSGGVTVKLAPGAGYDLSADTGSGHISVPEMTVRTTFSRHHIDGKIRGGGPLVDIHVDSGSVRVE
jgi:hypothetical protein